MSNPILACIEQPLELEVMYRENPKAFSQELTEALKVQPDAIVLQTWHARLNYSPSHTTRTISITFLLSICTVVALLVRLPMIYTGIEEDWFAARYIPLTLAGALTFYFVITQPTTTYTRLTLGAIFASLALYLSQLPNALDSDSVTMSLIHLPLFLLSLVGVSFVLQQWNNTEARLNFIRYLGEMGLYSVLILIGGVVLSLLTLGLFELIGLSVTTLFKDYIIIIGSVCAPIVATYLYDAVQQRQGKLAPLLAKVFAPLFLLTVTAYLIATLLQGKSPFTDRDFLILFNGLLLIILGITIYSIADRKQSTTKITYLSDIINIALIIITLLVNLTALSAIVFRWAEYGMTVNRIAVTGVNLLICIHLYWLLWRYIAFMRGNASLHRLQATITQYLPVYCGWSLFVVFTLPALFGYE